MKVDAKNYEFAYLLSSSLPEEEVLVQTSKLTSMIEDAKGTIRHIEQPKRRALAYSIGKEQTAYFGWTTFTMAPERVAGLEKKLKSITEVIRFLLIIEQEMTPFSRPMRTFASHATPAPSALPPRDPAIPEEKLDLEALDKKLEEILGK